MMVSSAAVPCLALVSIAAAIHANDELVVAAFGRRDLLWIATLFAVSVATWGVSGIRTGRWRAILAAVSLSVTVWAIAVFAAGDGANVPLRDTIAPSHAALLGLYAAGICLAMAVRRPATSTSQHPSALPQLGLIALSVLAPVAYGHSVAEASRTQLIDALQSGRIARAHQLACAVGAVHPQAVVLDIPVPELIDALDAERKALAKRLETALPVRPSSADVGERAVTLMQLDRNRDALELLEPLTANAAQAPAALDYCGLCTQRLGIWTASRDWYQKSRRFWIGQPAGPQRNEALLSACRGIAFAERRLNHPFLAEQAYKESLAISDSADTHFLLALLYEETQRTKLAEQHARSAASLSPQRYSEQSRQLLDRMALSHFRCAQVTTSGQSSAPIP